MDLFKNSKIIAATRSDEDFLKALNSEPKVIFDLYPDLMNISLKVKKAHEVQKKYFVHMDLAKGLGKDESALRFLRRIGVEGILSTKAGVIKIAKDCGLCTIQRFFIVDSQSVHTLMENVRNSKPDMIEIMPAIVYKVIENVSKTTNVPVIVGGLVDGIEEIRRTLECGAVAVSTGKGVLWNEKIGD